MHLSICLTRLGAPGPTPGHPFCSFFPLAQAAPGCSESPVCLFVWLARLGSRGPTPGYHVCLLAGLGLFLRPPYSIGVSAPLCLSHPRWLDNFLPSLHQAIDIASLLGPKNDTIWS